MDISAISKSLVIIYYLTSLYFIKTSQNLVVKDGNNIQKNIRHSRSRPYYLIDNRHISDSATHSPNIKSLISYSHSTNQTIENSDKSNFMYFLDSPESFRRDDQINNQQVIDVMTDRKVTNPTPAAHRFDHDINKSLVGVENSPSESGGSVDRTQNNNYSMFFNDTGNNTYVEMFTQKAQKDALSDENKKEETGTAQREGSENKSDENNENVRKGEEFPQRTGHVDIVTRFLRIVESQHLLGENCTAGTDLNLGEGVVDRYAQERFRIEADVAVNRANMLTRLWKYADHTVMSEYFLHASVFSMVEFDDDIFAAGNCYDQYQYKEYILFCPYAYRLPEGQILVKDLAIEYKYLSNTSEWFYIARKNAERVIKNYNQFSKGEFCYGHLHDFIRMNKNPVRQRCRWNFHWYSARCCYVCKY